MTEAYNYIPLPLPDIGNGNGIAYIKLFTPDSSWSWYISEYDSETQMCYGLVHGSETEYGTFSLDEIREVRGWLGLPVERDLWFQPKLLSECH